MPIVTFLPSRKTIEVSSGSLLFDAACRARLPVASSCSEKFVCGKCNMEILEGEKNLSPQREVERELLRKHKKAETDRVSCVTRVYGDCSVRTTYW